jgi:hypothetical protein
MKLHDNVSTQYGVLSCKGNLMNYFTLTCKHFVINTPYETLKCASFTVFVLCVCFG